MLKEPISITSFASVSALGSTSEQIWENYLNTKHFLTLKENVWTGQLTSDDKLNIEKIKNSDTKYKNLDASVLYTILVARKAIDRYKLEVRR